MFPANELKTVTKDRSILTLDSSPFTTFQTAFQNAWVQLQNPAQLIQKTTAFAKSARNLTPTQLAAGGVLAAEILGFFTVGEIVGRFKLVGYHGGAPAAAH